jgi:hypothetical protein
MKKIMILIGSLLIAVVVFFCGWQHYRFKKEEYRQQLEYTINGRYLERKNTIGAFYYYDNVLRKNLIEIRKVSDYSFDEPSWMYGDCVSFFGGLLSDHSSVIRKMLTSGEYKWFDFSNCETTYPFMIIVKKTNFGYDIIGEYILGIGLKYSYPDYLIYETPYESFLKFLNTQDFVTYKYEIESDMIDSYINFLFDEKYKGITIRNEITRDNNGIKRNIKLDMLENLVMKASCPGDSSLFFRVNKYFELKEDDNFTSMGSSPIVWQTGTYGNRVHTIFTKTVTIHYSIQENEGLLWSEYKIRIAVIILILEGLYFFILIMIYKIKQLKVRKF